MWRSNRPVDCSNKGLRLERHISESATLRTKWARAHLMREICLSGSTSGMWRRSQGSSIETPLSERCGNSRDAPTATAPHLDSTHLLGVARARLLLRA